MITTIIIASVMTILGIVILVGKGDKLIAGYNTGSEEDRKKYDVRRLRIIIGIMLILMAIASLLLLFDESIIAMLSFAPIVFVLIVVAFLLVNNWAKIKN